MTTQITVLTGPESSGKTTLATHLSEHWEAPQVTEFARDYLQGRPSYSQNDLLHIARQQQLTETQALASTPKRIVCDTDLLVIIIWSEVRYKQCDPWIYEAFENSINQSRFPKHFFLCDPNIPWEFDELRENPNNRLELFDLYLKKLEDYKVPFSIVKGDPNLRLEQALSFAEKINELPSKVSQ